MTSDLKKDDIEIIKSAYHMADRLEELHRDKQFHEFQVAVFNAIFKKGKKRIFIRKGRKGGGTETILYPLARVAGTKRNAACYLIGPTQKMQCEIIWHNRRLNNFLPREWNPVPHEQDKRIRLANGSFIKVEGADDPNAARGWEGDIFVWDELKDHNPLSLEACYPNVLSRDAIWIVLGTPPTKKTNHYYIMEQQIKDDPDWEFFHWTSWDNPFLPGGHEFLREEKKKYYQRGDGDIWEIEYEARYVFNARRKVLPNFTDKNKKPRGVILPYLQRDASHLKWIASIDPGYATCFAVLFAAYNPYTNEIFYLDEIYSKNRDENSALKMWPLIEEKQARLHRGKWSTLYDSAALGFAVEVRALAKEDNKKVNLIPVKKEKGDEDTWFRVMNGTFAQDGQATVAEELVNFTEEMESYETDDKDNYPDADNHQLDNGRYINKFLGVKPIMKQIIITRENPLPQGFTMQDDLQKERSKSDMSGFGGIEADFDIGSI